MKTLRVFLSACLSLSFLYHPSFALAKTSKSNWESYNQFFKQTGITKKEVKFSEFFAKTKDLYPEPLRKELEAFVKENPDVKLPKFAISKLKDSDGNENIELRYSSGSESNSLTLITGDNPVYKIGNRKIGYPEILLIDRVAQLLTSSAAKGSASTRAQGLVQTNTEVMQKMPVLLLLSAEDFKKLPKPAQEIYLKDQRLLMASLESTNDSFERFKVIQEQKKGKKQKDKKAAFIYRNLLLEAHATSNKSCIIGGNRALNPTSYYNFGECSLLTHGTHVAVGAVAGAAGGATVGSSLAAPVSGAAVGAAAGAAAGAAYSVAVNRCSFCGRDQMMNYPGGEGVANTRPTFSRGCLGTYEVKCNPDFYGKGSPCIDARSVTNVTEACNQKVKDVYAGLRDKDIDSDDKFNSTIRDAYDSLKNNCEEIKEVAAEDPASVKECESLKARIDALKNSGFCKLKPKECPTNRVAPADAEGAVLPDPDADAAEVVRCDAYSGYQLRDPDVVEDCGNKMESFNCINEEGRTKNVIACQCGAGQAIQQSGVWKCAKASTSADAGGASKPGLWQQNKSWIKPTVVAAAFIAFMFAIRKSNEKATDLYYRRIQPVNPLPSTPAPAPPATAPPATTPPPAPRGVN